MKNAKPLLLLFGILVLLLFSCNKNNDILLTKKDGANDSGSQNVIKNSDIMGIWVNSLNSKDIMRILDSTTINRWDASANGYYHFYSYKIIVDSIILNYTGLYKIGTPPYHRKMYLNNRKDSLRIHNFNSVYPGNSGDTFIKSSK